MKSLRVFAPIILAILSLGMAAYQSAQTIIHRSWEDRANDMVSKWEERIQTLRQALPPGTTHVGYVNSSTIDRKSVDFDGEELFLMQYSIAPVILEVGVEHQWVIGNFDKDTKFRPWLNTVMKKFEVQNLGAGLYLIHNLDK